MTFLPIKPVAPGGNDWDGSAAFVTLQLSNVDAKVLSDNWQTLFSHVNGNINASDFAWPALWVFREDEIIFERSYAQTVVRGEFHNHDGYNSSPLGLSSIGKNELKSATDGTPASYGAIWGGGQYVTSLVFFGQALFPEIKASTYKSDLIAVPYDKYKWSYASGPESLPARTGSSYGTSTIVATMESDSLYPQSTFDNMHLATMAVGLAGGNAGSFSVGIKNNNSIPVYNIKINWMIVALKYTY